MEHTFIIDCLSKNKPAFAEMLSGINEEQYNWRPEPEKWNLLEIVCHLYDEEQFDFKLRIKTVLETPGKAAPPIDPAGWVKQKNYAGQNYSEMLRKFLDERKASIDWLRSLKSAPWKNQYVHQTFGPMSAEFFLSNWLAHDYLHFRQIIALKYNYLKFISGSDQTYAGKW